ncbi:MAG: hypothetical protein V4440_08730 [Pseudomonadota bacterium]
MFKKPVPNKGVRGKLCNTKSCNNTGAAHFNNVTKAWYCTGCAERIERAANKLDMSLFYNNYSNIAK